MSVKAKLASILRRAADTLSPAPAGRWMPDRGDLIEDHFDHVHVSFGYSGQFTPPAGAYVTVAGTGTGTNGLIDSGEWERTR